jgi:NADH:ubiquinone reductase (non-electrogenic)
MTPLLPSVSVGTVETRTVIESIRSLVGPRVKYVEAYCVDVDPKTKTITCNSDGVNTVSRGDDVKTILAPSKRQGGASSRIIKDSGQLKEKLFFVFVLEKKNFFHLARTRPQFDMKYDFLVVAIGSENNTFNTPGVEEHAHFLKELLDARRIRSAISDAFESAMTPSQTEEERKRLLHFVVVGGGPTGVEFAAEVRFQTFENTKTKKKKFYFLIF